MAWRGITESGFQSSSCQDMTMNALATDCIDYALFYIFTYSNCSRDFVLFVLSYINNTKSCVYGSKERLDGALGRLKRNVFEFNQAIIEAAYEGLNSQARSK